jgi:putative FmdB family regulatory protein
VPLYDYVCAACGRRFEVIHGVHADPPTACPLCGSGPVRKAIAAPAVHFKGSGWAKKERRASAGSTAAKDGSTESTAEPAGSAGTEPTSSATKGSPGGGSGRSGRESSGGSAGEPSGGSAGESSGGSTRTPSGPTSTGD